MLRWLIVILLLANLGAFAAVRGAFGPLPSASPRETQQLNRQIHPDWLRVQALSAAEAADQVVVGSPMPEAPVAASTVSP
ncbi:hypothetical protein QS306_13405 [Paraburkholderia bonniea]|uniref:hypothetical protein n=1 Tax=Paraburkholderia bonniea TaxID=2152891 RepID=UPI001292078B|nr:hypothetical protein [Paraburkholderia bonniea]WJF90073.1 hypothetical protein QS306_13405 [Paraburkholderia bonniea]WJF93387.1 hypothetical protein QS308_13415 [Paraburkholderia bonniea]